MIIGSDQMSSFSSFFLKQADCKGFPTPRTSGGCLGLRWGGCLRPCCCVCVCVCKNLETSQGLGMKRPSARMSNADAQCETFTLHLHAFTRRSSLRETNASIHEANAHEDESAVSGHASSSLANQDEMTCWLPGCVISRPSAALSLAP